MNELKTILSEGLDSYAGMLAKNAISSAEKATYRDYKSAYIDFLKVIDECGVDEHCVPLERYWIYDIDKDLTPELLVLYRDCEANSCVFVYTYTDNIVKNIVYSGSKSNVAMTMIGGIIRYERGSFNIGATPEDIYRKAEEISKRLYS